MTRARSFVCLAAVLIASCIAQAQSPDQDFSIVALPDTQNYAATNPAIFNAQTQWIVQNAGALNIKLVLHEGDIVNGGGDPTQWKAADAAMKILDQAQIPYVAVIGNHDYDHADPKGRTASTVHFNQYFGPSRYANSTFYQGSYQSGSNENFYSVFTINGQQLLVMALEVYPRDSVLDWANAILDANPDMEVIILTHSYMYSDDTRVGACDKGGKKDLAVPNDNDGEDMWNKLVRKHANISLVLSGHIVWNKGIGRRVDLGDNGNLVNEMLADFQNYAGGGDGYLRVLTFHPATNSIDVQTYSPWLNKSLTDAPNQFTLKWHADGNMTGTPSLVEGRVRGKDCSVISSAAISADDASAQSDANGILSFTTMAGSPMVSVAASGWISQTMQVAAPQGAGAQVEFFLDPAGKIAGTVKDSGGIPISGSTVTISGTGDPITLTSDQNGAFATEWIAAGTYTVSAQTSDGQQASASVTVTTGQTLNVDLMIASSSPGHTLISGVIISAIDGRALSGATVTAGSKITTADTSGKYSFADIAPGTYTVTATKSGWGKQSTTVTLTDGGSATANIQLATSGRISGTVKRTDGSAAAGVTVTFIGGVIASSTSVTTSSSGSFNSSWIPVGDYQVTATDPTNSATASVTIAAGDLKSVPLTLGNATPPPPPPPDDGTVSLTGRIVSVIDGRVLSGATVTLGNQSTTTNTQGVYTFTGLAETTYTVTATKSGWGRQSMSVSLGSGANTAPDLNLATSGRITGKVTASGSAASGVTITFTGGVINNTTSVTTRSDGTYVSGWIPVGNYAVTASRNGVTRSGTASVTAGGNMVVNFAY